MKDRRILILVFSNLKHDARVTRQVQWASRLGSTTVACFDSNEIPNVEIIRFRQTPLTRARKALLATLLVSKLYRLAYKVFHSYDSLVKQLRAQAFDVIIANDIDTLPMAFEIDPKAKIVFDAHEYAPRHFENNTTWRFFFQPFYQSLCREYIPKVQAMFTVGDGLANEYHKEFNVRPVVITNAARFHELSPSLTSATSIRLIHHGIANKSRRLELMVEMMDHLDDRFTLDMILMISDYASPQTKAYIESLKNAISRNGRIRILPSVESHRVVETIKNYDMGVFIIPPINFNYANTLPNKLFDFIQARLGVAIGPTPEMANIVRKYKLGVVADDFDPKNLAEKLNRLTSKDVDLFKAGAANAATELNAEMNEKRFRDVILSL